VLPIDQRTRFLPLGREDEESTLTVTTHRASSPDLNSGTEMTDILFGIDVLQILIAASESIKASGQPQKINAYMEKIDHVK